MVDVRGDVLRPPHGTTSAAVKANKNKKMSSFKSNENIPIQTLIVGPGPYIVWSMETDSTVLERYRLEINLLQELQQSNLCLQV